MTQSCPTPPQSRRRFFLSPKTLRAPWGLMSKIGQGQNGGADSPVVLSGEYLLYHPFSFNIIFFSDLYGGYKNPKYNFY